MIIKDKRNDRLIFIEKNENKRIIGLNFIQGIHEETLSIYTEDNKELNDEKFLKFYRLCKQNRKFNEDSEIEEINNICWLYLDLKMDDSWL